MWSNLPDVRLHSYFSNPVFFCEMSCPLPRVITQTMRQPLSVLSPKLALFLLSAPIISHSSPLVGLYQKRLSLSRMESHNATKVLLTGDARPGCELSKPTVRHTLRACSMVFQVQGHLLYLPPLGVIPAPGIPTRKHIQGTTRSFSAREKLGQFPGNGVDHNETLVKEDHLSPESTNSSTDIPPSESPVVATSPSAIPMSPENTLPIPSKALLPTSRTPTI